MLRSHSIKTSCMCQVRRWWSRCYGFLGYVSIRVESLSLEKFFFKKFNKANQVNIDFFCYLCVINHSKKKHLS